MRGLSVFPALIFHDFINTREQQGNLVVFITGFREQAKGLNNDQEAKKEAGR